MHPQIGELPNPDTSQINALHLKLKTSQLIRSAQGIRDIAHELKMMLLLSDQVEEAIRRDKEAKAVAKEVVEGRRRVGDEVSRLLGGDKGDNRNRERDRKQEDEHSGMEVDQVDVPEQSPKREQNEVKMDDKDDQQDEDEDDDGFEQVA